MRGTISYRVNKVEADRVELAVATDATSAGVARTEVYTKDGDWNIFELAQVRSAKH